jgi:hypothetical protein
VLLEELDADPATCQRLHDTCSCWTSSAAVLEILVKSCLHHLILSGHVCSD